MINKVSDLNKSLKVSTSGMTAQNKRMLIISQNMANANTKPATLDEKPYQRKIINLGNQHNREAGVSTVTVKSVSVDSSPFKEVYAPEDPMANEKGIVLMPNVNPMMEMMDMREAGLSHEANLRAYEKTLRMMEETIGILKGG